MTEQPSNRQAEPGLRAAVVVPVYGQADLMAETVASLLAQDGAEPFAVMLVDDCCTDPRTARKAAMLATAHPGRIFYWRAPENGGLSAIRNAGVRRALELWPDLEAVAFVDGDDKVFARYVARGLDLLRRHGGQPTADGGRVGWNYDDWHQFGTPENLNGPTPYNPLFALAGCQHTPGCFCLADMFRAGLWFDETRRGGDAEDWQFWVNCQANGWRGHHGAPLGFRYRRRVGGLASAGAEAVERSRVLIQKQFQDLYHPDWFLAQETAQNTRHLVLDDQPGATLGLDGPRLQPDELGALLIRLAQLSTAAAPAHALIFTGAARARLAAAGLLDWAAWFVEARDKDEIAALSLGRGATSGVELRAARALQTPGPTAVVSMPLVRLARAMVEGRKLADLAAAGEFRHHLLMLDPQTPSAPADAPSMEAHQTRLDAALAPFDQPAHNWHRETAWQPFGAGRAGLDRLHLGHSAPLSDPGARHASLIVASAQDLSWRSEDLDLPTVVRHFERRDGTAPSLCVTGSEIPGEALAELRLRSLFLLPPALAAPGQGGRFEPEGLFAAFGTVAMLDCADLIPALNGVRRFGCRTVAVLPRQGLPRSNLAHVLLNAFKAFQSVLIRSESQYAHMLALGCAREIVSREMIAPARTGAMEQA